MNNIRLSVLDFMLERLSFVVVCWLLAICYLLLERHLKQCTLFVCPMITSRKQSQKKMSRK